MKKAALLIGMGLAGFAAWAYARTSGGTVDTTSTSTAPEPTSAGAAWAWVPATFDFWTLQNHNETTTKVQDMQTTIDPAQNLRAFLHAIARAEGTANRADPYRVCYGYKFTIGDFADHPAVLGVWKGEPLTAAMCKAAGFGPGCVSTAAGKYQITKPTWTRLKTRLKLPDFSPASQDLAATELLRECGALDLARRGEVQEAAFAARKIWASLPGAGYDQPERTAAWLETQYQAAGGVLA